MTRPLVWALAFAFPFLLGAVHGYHDARHLAAVNPLADTLVIGASVTFRWPERAPGSWLETFGPDVQVLGRPGMQTRHILADLPIRTSASRIVVDLGGCDLRKDVPAVEAALGVAKIVALLVSSTDADIYVLAQVGEDLDPTELNAWIEALLAGWPRTVFVPLPRLEYLADLKHPSEDGYTLMGAAIQEVYPGHQVQSTL